MSLINQVLEDLDRRRLEETTVTGVDDLSRSQVLNNSSSSKRVVLFSVLSILIGAAGMFAYLIYVNKPIEQTQNTPAASHSETAEQNTAKPEPEQKTVKNSQQVTTNKTKQAQASVAAQPQVSKPVTKKPAAIVEAKTEEEGDSTLAGPATPFKKKVVPLRAEQRAELSYQAGYDQLKAKRYGQAEQSLRQALTIEPDHIKSRELLSGIYIQQGRWVEASEILRQGVQLTPGHRTFSKLYARSLMQLNHDARAIEVLEQRRPRVQDDPNHFAILAALYQRQGRHALAAETYASILKINSGNGVWWVGLGISLEALGRHGEAGQAYAHARKTGNLQAEVSRFADQRLVALDEMRFPVEH